MSEGIIEPQSQIELKLDKERYIIHPLEQVTVKLLLSNPGAEEDAVTLIVQGVPPAWITISQTIVSLEPGEGK